MNKLNIIINGPPGAGKTTLARELSPMIGAGIIEKDSIKEELADALGFGTPEQHRILKDISYSIMARLLSESPHLIAVANFPPQFNSLVQPNLRLAEIHCRCALETSRRRFGAREQRHSVHPPVQLSDEEIIPYMKPLGMGPVFQVNTEREVNFDDIISWLNRI